MTFIANLRVRCLVFFEYKDGAVIPILFKCVSNAGNTLLKLTIKQYFKQNTVNKSWITYTVVSFFDMVWVMLAKDTKVFQYINFVFKSCHGDISAKPPASICKLKVNICNKFTLEAVGQESLIPTAFWNNSLGKLHRCLNNTPYSYLHPSPYPTQPANAQLTLPAEASPGKPKSKPKKTSLSPPNSSKNMSCTQTTNATAVWTILKKNVAKTVFYFLIKNC